MSAVRVTINGVEHRARAGETLAAALAHAGARAARRSVSGELRGPLCGMGVCFECRVTVNGVPHQRACLLTVADGMTVRTEENGPTIDGSVTFREAGPAPDRECDVVVIGAGPAGLAAAWSAASSSSRPRVIVLDENAHSGGQIWRADGGRPASSWRRRVEHAGIEVLHGVSVLYPGDHGSLQVHGPNGSFRVRSAATVIATGSTELFLPFPGWTLPNVVGAGGLQALAKSGFDVRSRRVVVAGSGPLLLAVAASLRNRGARVVLVAEQADAAALRAFAATLARRPAKLVQAMALKARLLGVDQWYSAWPVAARGTDHLQEVEIHRAGRSHRIQCDILACGFGLVPHGRVAALLGCQLDGPRVRVDECCRTTADRVFAAGECAGIGGVDKALAEGMAAGAAAAGDLDRARALASRVRDERGFAERLSAAFRLRPELFALADERTVVCRCEDVTWGRVSGADSWRDAKVHTRCGMGPCQGRVCGPALSFLKAWSVADARPPICNVPLGALAGDRDAVPAEGNNAARTPESHA